MSTAHASEPIAGSKLYQERARQALPLLVRQAEAKTTISYGSLAAELGIPNPRNLNFVLGCIGQTLRCLAREWNENIPPIQSVVVNQKTGVPGDGLDWFLDNDGGAAALPEELRRAKIETALATIFAYPYWNRVLAALSLPRPVPPLTGRVSPTYGSGGESPEHHRLKHYVALHPELVGLPRSAQPGRTEACLLSGDFLDVSFVHGQRWVAAEVKSAISSVADIQRGLFQCLKYRAVMQAQIYALGERSEVRAVLVLAVHLPNELRALRNLLGVDVIENVTIPD